MARLHRVDAAERGAVQRMLSRVSVDNRDLSLSVPGNTIFLPDLPGQHGALRRLVLQIQPGSPPPSRKTSEPSEAAFLPWVDWLQRQLSVVGLLGLRSLTLTLGGLPRRDRCLARLWPQLFEDPNSPLVLLETLHLDLSGQMTGCQVLAGDGATVCRPMLRTLSLNLSDNNLLARSLGSIVSRLQDAVLPNLKSCHLNVSHNNLTGHTFICPIPPLPLTLFCSPRTPPRHRCFFLFVGLFVGQRSERCPLLDRRWACG